MDEKIVKYIINNPLRLAFGIFLIWIFSGIIIWFCFESEKRGIFGDMFGAVNSLFSGFALAGIIYTILLQREELSLQREELRLTRDEMKRSADAQENADKSFKEQVELMYQSNVIAGKTSLLNTHLAKYEILKKENSSSIHRNFETQRIEKLMQEIQELTSKQT
jgi:hypothetical protein